MKKSIISVLVAVVIIASMALPAWATTDNNVTTVYSAAVTLLQSRGYPITATNIAEAEQEILNYPTSNRIIGTGSTVTGGTMEVAGITYLYVNGQWVVKNSFDGSRTISQSDLNQIAAYRLARQQAQAAGDTKIVDENK